LFTTTSTVPPPLTIACRVTRSIMLRRQLARAEGPSPGEH
jgi:hypothetical protein